MEQTSAETEAAIQAHPEKISLYFRLLEQQFRALDWRGVSRTIDTLEEAHPDVWEAQYQKGLQVVTGAGIVLLATAALFGLQAVLSRRA